MSEETIDVRGEICSMPELRVEKFLKENAARAPFTVIVDHRPTLESIRELAARHGWACEVREERRGEWHLRFTVP